MIWATSKASPAVVSTARYNASASPRFDLKLSHRDRDRSDLPQSGQHLFGEELDPFLGLLD
jgi:hypothetical protein